MDGLSGAERRKLLRAERRAAERAVNQTAPPPTPAEGEEPISPLVRSSEPVRGVAVQRDRGARSHVLVKKERKKKKDPPPPTPADPRGRGRAVDLRG